MAERKPIILDDAGKLAELPTDDALAIAYRWRPYHITPGLWATTGTFTAEIDLIDDTVAATYSRVFMGAFVYTSEEWTTTTTGTGGDRFGQAVGVHDGLAVVGSYLDDGAGANGGAAYLIDLATGSFLFRLVGSDTAAGDEFGFSVSITEGLCVVGARNHNGSRGAAYVFDTTTGLQVAKLVAGDAATNDFFGESVGIDGSLAVVGAPFNDDTGNNSGSAYVFTAATGSQTQKLVASDAAANDNFGNAVAISGGVAVVGSKFDDDAPNSSGSAYTFNVVTGSQVHKLVASDAAANDRFGFSVAIDGGSVLVGALRNDDTAADSGSAYLFSVSTGVQAHKLVASDAAASDQFGYAVSIDGGVAAVSAWQNDDTVNNAGSAYLFDVAAGTQTAKLVASDPIADDLFGRSISIQGDDLIVGAAFVDYPSEATAGAAYYFGVTEEQQFAKYRPVDGFLDVSIDVSDGASYRDRNILQTHRLYPQALSTDRGRELTPQQLAIVAAGATTVTAKFTVSNGDADITDVTQGDSTVWILWGELGPDLRD